MGDRSFLQMWSGLRERLIEELDFYKEQADTRILTQFDNMTEDADAFANRRYDEMGQFFNPDTDDPGDHAEQAYEDSIDFYMLLDGMRKQVYLSVVAGMYHEFDKKLREFLISEIGKDFDTTTLSKKLWQADFDKIVDVLDGCGWEVRKQPFFDEIEQCRLIVNVYKHGSGNSFESLKAKYPNYLRPDYVPSDDPFMEMYSDYTYLQVSKDDIARFHKAIRAFWMFVPKDTLVSQAKNLPTWFANALNTDNS